MNSSIENHQVFLSCEYCHEPFIENIFKVTRQSEFIYQLINIADNDDGPISSCLEPKICCHPCYLMKLKSHYQVLQNQRKLKKFIPKL